MTELLVILVVGLLVLGPKRLPDLARSLGRGLAEFRRASTEIHKDLLDVAEEVRSEPLDDGASSEKADGPTAPPAPAVEPEPTPEGEGAASPSGESKAPAEKTGETPGG